MKKVFLLKKTYGVNVDVIDDPSIHIGKEYIFDEFYTIIPVSTTRDSFVVSLEIDGISQISRISFIDFFNHIQKGNLVEKVSVGETAFESYSEYYEMASSFLLINYNIGIDSIIFDWETEFYNETPVEIACKLALGIIKK